MKNLAVILAAAAALLPYVAAGSLPDTIAIHNETQHGVMVKAYERNRHLGAAECVHAGSMIHLGLPRELTWVLHFEVFSNAGCDGHIVWTTDSIAPRNPSFQPKYVVGGSRARFWLHGP